MKTVISWNVNGFRAIASKGFYDWLAACGADAVCVQETKAHASDLSGAQRAPDGYDSIWTSAEKKGYSGVAVFYRRGMAPLSVNPLGNSAFDREGRVQVIEFQGFTVVNTYWPNSQNERARLPYKLEFGAALTRALNRLRKAGRNLVICGDFNIAHTEIDLARPKQNENNAGYYIEERQFMTKFLKAGYVDTFRHFCKEPGHYSWWSYRGRAREKNVGWRLDYHCVNEEFLPAVLSSTIQSEIRGSDHCPVTIKFEA